MNTNQVPEQNPSFVQVRKGSKAVCSQRCLGFVVVCLFVSSVVATCVDDDD